MGGRSIAELILTQNRNVNYRNASPLHNLVPRRDLICVVYVILDTDKPQIRPVEVLNWLK